MNNNITKTKLHFRQSLMGRILLYGMGVLLVLELIFSIFLTTMVHNQIVNESLDRAYFITKTMSANQSERTQIQDSLLEAMDAYFIRGNFNGFSPFLWRMQLPDMKPRVISMDAGLYKQVENALTTFFAPADELVFIEGRTNISQNESMQILRSVALIQSAQREIVITAFLLSLFIAVLIAILIFLLLHYAVVRPVQSLAYDMGSFARDPLSLTVLKSKPYNSEMGILHDSFVAMRKTVQEAFRQESRLSGLGRGVSKLNHDLNNVLSAISLNAEALTMVDHPLVKKSAQRLLKSVENGQKLTEAVSSYSKQGKIIIKSEKIELIAIVKDAWYAALGAQQLKHDDRTLVITPSTKIYLQSDAVHLLRLITNLLLNALQADAQSLKLNLKQQTDRLHILIQDDGKGIPQAVMNSIFQPFVRGGRQGGSGLGMNIAREIATNLGGGLRVVSTSEQGTTLELVLPIEAKQSSDNS